MEKKIITREEAQKLNETINRFFYSEDDFDWEKSQEALRVAAEATRNLLAANGITHIAIPRCLGYRLPDNRLAVVDDQDGYSIADIKDHYDCEHIFLPGVSGSGIALLAVLDALDYYRENNIPKSDWGIENDITRQLRQANEVYSAKVIPEHTEEILGKECSVVTLVKFFSDHGMRLHTIINFQDATPDDYKTGYYASLSEDECWSQCFDAMIELECGVRGIADLISHYGIPVGTTPEMLTALAEAMRKNAEANGFRSCKDFVPLLSELGVIYSMRTREQHEVANQGWFPTVKDEWYDDEKDELDCDDPDDEEFDMDDIEYDEAGFEDPV